MIRIRTLERIDDPQRPGASIRSGVTISIQKAFADKLIAAGKAELVSGDQGKADKAHDQHRVRSADDI